VVVVVIEFEVVVVEEVFVDTDFVFDVVFVVVFEFEEVKMVDDIEIVVVVFAVVVVVDEVFVVVEQVFAVVVVVDIVVVFVSFLAF
jgi:hypothetical protein